MERQDVVLESIQVGKPRTMTGEQAPHEWTSGIHKAKVTGAVFVGKINLHGDSQADLEHHGGPDRPILMYSADHYGDWQEKLGVSGLTYGWFGENFTVSGLTEELVSLGDTFQVGDVVIQVSQPRNPCWKLARRVGVPDLVEQVNMTGKSGWYARVLAEGNVESGAKLVLVDRPCPDMTITFAQQVWKRRKTDTHAARVLAECPYLSADWRRVLENL